MDDINNINETGGAGDWGTDKARAKLQTDTPAEKPARKRKMKKFREVLEGVDVISENLSKNSKDVAKEINDAARKETGGDKRDFQNVAKMISQNKHKEAAKYMAKLDTVIIEDLVSFIMGHEEVFKKMYPKAKPGQYVVQFARKVEDDQQFAMKLPEEKNCGCGQDPCITYGKVDEAMSEKDKKKRLAMIKKAVEKMNKQNMEKAKKDALAMMKASGMFDEDAELQEIKKAPQIKHLNIYGSEISGLRSGTKYYQAMAIDMRGKLMYKVIDEFGSIETIDLKTFAKRFG